MPASLGLLAIPLVFLFMVGLGLSLTLADFRRLIQNPKDILVGLGGQIILLPAVGYLIAYFFRSDPVIAQGLVLLTAAPGGPVSNSMVYVGRGRPEISVSLNAFSSALALITMPVIASYGLYFFSGESASISLPIPRTIAEIFLLTLLPLVIGMLILRKWPDWVRARERLIRNFVTVLMLLIIFIVVSTSWRILTDNFADLALSAVVFLATMLLLCYAGTVLFGLDSATRFTIVTEVTIHNIVLVALIATTILNRPELALMSIVVQIPLALGLLVWVFYRKARIAGLPSVAPPPFAPRET